ncbi:Hypothetical protein NTJ_06842 [Nesidiocoris tenuis]|uniref:Reverse transcriptase domain-containing protein n=1 Tax=Nesidiocoris tenuis TaxID=355587 RepID=A0ABN7AP85_9HEMI|nr:Hypothetical protein NTJ_06842 [Nesidiocoris tenuis]
MARLLPAALHLQQWQHINLEDGQPLRGNKQLNGSFVDPFQHPELALQVLRKINAVPVDEASLGSNEGSPNSENPAIFPQISTFELKQSLYNLKKNSAPGIDGFAYEMIAQLPETAITILKAFYNCCIQHHHPLKAWKEIKILYVKKQQAIHPSQLSATDIRPLALISCFAKLLNIIMKKRLEVVVENNSILPKHSHGFRKQHGTYNNLTELYLEILNEKAQGNSTQCIFLDISGAYNQVDITKLKDIMTRSQIPEYIVNWVHTFFTKKTYVDGMNVASGDRGLDQGSTISPLLFNIYTSMLGLNLEHGKMSLYADDCALTVSGKDINTNIAHLEQDISALNIDLEQLGLVLNSQKTSFISFFDSMSKRDRELLQVEVLPGQRIKAAEKHKYLGVIFDPKLKWNLHIKNTILKMKRDINALKYLKGSSWGNHPTDQLKLYTAVCRPKAEYASHVTLWNNPVLKSVQVVQNAAIRQSIGAVKTTPIPSLHCVSAILPIEIRIDELSRRTYNKLMTSSPEINELCVSLTTYGSARMIAPTIKLKDELTQLMATRTQFNIRSFQQTPTIMPTSLNNKCHINIPDLAKKDSTPREVARQLSLDYINNQFPHHVKIYSDGSKKEEGVAAGFYCSNDNMASGKRLHNISSIFTAELGGILMAAEHVRDSHPENTKFVILSDSKAAIERIRNIKPGDAIPLPLVSIIILILELSITNRTVELCWIPSHVGIQGNEAVDRTVGETAQSGYIHPTTTSNSEDLSTTFKTNAMQKWSQQYDLDTITVGRWSKAIYTHPPTKPWFDGINFEPRALTTITRVLLGHGFTPHFRVLMRKANDDICPHCKPSSLTMDVYHILQECRKTMPRINSAISPFTNIIDFLKANLKQPQQLKKIHDILNDLEVQI